MANSKNSIWNLTATGRGVWNFAKPLNIDDEISALLAKRSRYRLRSELNLNREDLIRFGRRMLGFAIHRARVDFRKRNSRGKEYWEDLAVKCQAAEVALDRFLSTLVDGKLTRKSLAFYFISAHTQTLIERRIEIKRPQTLYRIENAAAALLKAKGTLRWYARYCEKTVGEIGPRVNPGAPERAAFAHQVIEGWVYLTGSIPSPSNVRFCDFLAAAWIDATGEGSTDDWGHHIRNQASRYKHPSAMRRLLKDGPLWADDELFPWGSD